MMPVSSDAFGFTKDGRPVKRYTLTNVNGLSVQLIEFGAIITSVCVPDRNGVFTDVTPGFDNVSDYEQDGPYYGAIIGRVANRISGAQFTLDGVDYHLEKNDDPNHNHGGSKGWHKLLFEGSVKQDSVAMTLVSPDGDSNYPGEVTCTVTYSLTNDNELVVDVHATTTKATPINIASHPYFNLTGHDSPTVYDHLVTIHGTRYAVKTDTNVPSGELAPVHGTLFDLQKPVRLGDRVQHIMGAPGYEGFDHTFQVGNEHTKKHIARLEAPSSGRVVDIFSTQPAVHMYTANFVENVKGKEGAVYNKHSAVALESQNFPNAINQPSFPNSVIRPGDEYKQTTWFKFSVA